MKVTGQARQAICKPREVARAECHPSLKIPIRANAIQQCHYQEGITAYAYITVHRFGHSAIGHLHVPPCQVADAKRPLQIRCSVDKFHNNGCQFETLLASLNNRNNHTEISTLIVLDRNFQR
jgi:hypothetical protein